MLTELQEGFVLIGFMAELVARGQHSSKLVELCLSKMLNKSLMLKVTYLSGLLLAPSICTWPGVDISSWPELELLCHSLAWPGRQGVGEGGG